MALFHMLRPCIEQLYDGRCDIIEAKGTTGVLNDGAEVLAYQDIPCRLDFDSITAAVNSASVTQAAQAITLLLAPEIVVKEGSKAVVTQNGRTTAFYCSGVPAVYVSHQEIPLVTEDRWC